MPGLRAFAVLASLAMAGMMAGMLAQSRQGRVQQIVPEIVAADAIFVSAHAATIVQPMPINGPSPRALHFAQTSLPERDAQGYWTTPEGQEYAKDVAGHLREIVPRELFAYFDLYLYVSKSASGPWAQHMYVFRQDANGDLTYKDSFPVSTGREMQEKYFTSTPTGLFELDPDRFDRVHYSHRWNGAAMPWAMFLNYTIHGHETGVAVHSGIGHEAHLGHRASGGCVRLPPDRAQALFEHIQAYEQGRVPVFAMDGTTTDVAGRMLRGENGEPVLTEGYKVLLVIENYPGAPVVVATIS